ncbi:MAG: hypothetical protein ACRDD7_11935 [Peptostreptococcaceae bacterium]
MNYEFEKRKLEAYIGKELYRDLKNYNCFIAGGTITSLFCNRDINDIDVYFRSKKDLAEFMYDNIEYGKWILAKTNKALLVKYKDIEVQLVWFDTFETAEEIFDTFDYTVCMGAFDFKTEEFILHKDFLQHNSQRILKYNSKTAYPIVSALRVDKYKEKGYTISKPEYMRVIMSCMVLNVDTYDELKEQLGGMYGIDYDEVIKPKDDEKFSVVDIIDKMQYMYLHKDYFKPKREAVDIEDFRMLIYEITGVKPKAFRFDGKLYEVFSGIFAEKEESFFEEIKSGSRVVYEEVDFMKDVLKSNKVYKLVEKTKDGKYISFYDNKFEYKIGETIIPDFGTYGYGGIWATIKEGLKYTTYSTRGNAAVIELEIDGIEDIHRLSGDDIVLKKCKFIGEVDFDYKNEDDSGFKF